MLYTLKLIDNEEFSADKVERIKVRMLMNKFMNEKEKHKFMVHLRSIENGIQETENDE